MIPTLVTRAFSVIFTTIVLGLSVSAVKWQVFGSAPATNTYGAFAGAFGLLVALIGLVAVWIEAIPGIIMAIVDGLSAILLLAGGIAFAVGVGGINCGDVTGATNRAASSSLINGGISKIDGSYCIGLDGLNCVSSYDPSKAASQLGGRCRQAQADTAFLFLAFATATTAAVLCFLSSRGTYNIGRHSAV